MKILKKRFPILLLALVIAILPLMLAVPAFASDTPMYQYGDMTLPKISETGKAYNVIFLESGTIKHFSFDSFEETSSGIHGNGYDWYYLEDGIWKLRGSYDGAGFTVYTDPIWCDFDAKDGMFVASEAVEATCYGSPCPSTDANKDNVCDDCGFKFAVLRDYSPFTVKKFMNHIGQILTSAVSWVGNVGSTILEQPLLLAFTALPLCGLGIAVFRRLKETV